MPRYDPKRIESKWQQFWEKHATFRAPELPEKKKLYVLDMFPYPSGEGLHVGHPEGYTATDIVSRYQRMCGRDVLHPMGWDAFGLPAEQHAIKTGTHPRTTTYKNIDTFRRQLKMLGFSYDWSRELATTDPEYFRWTQWIFLELFDTWFDPDFEWTDPAGRRRRGRGRPIAELPIPDEVAFEGVEAVRRYQDRHRLAYQYEAPVNWCPALGTVLANEEVVGGVSERGGHPVERIPLRQWMLRITAYAERLLEDLDNLDWSESIKALQRNWIGRSEGAELDFWIPPAELSGRPDAQEAAYWQWRAHRASNGFPSEAGEDVLRVYTTRPDTLFGATYMVMAPEHPYVERLTTGGRREAVEAYCRQAASKSDLDRTDLAKEKTGVFTGSYAVNPVNDERIPIWIADYVLVSYGTGAIMAVPAHDLRDWEFAVQFDLPIRQVVEPPADYEPTREEAALAREHNGRREFPFAGQGTAVNSEDFDGLSTAVFKTRITDDLASKGLGRAAVNYRLRDWLFSRQHYWGEPFPVLHELDESGEPTGLLRTVRAESLPLALPEMSEFRPHGRPEPPLAEAPEDWLYVDVDDPSVAPVVVPDGVPLAGARGSEENATPSGERQRPGSTSTGKLLRETNTMPQWAGSCWYYLRFIDPRNDRVFVDPEKERRWMPVDLYIGGAEHAVLHLLYARFWHKVLFDRGHVSTMEPFQRLVNQGMILGEVELTGYQTDDGTWVSADQVAGGVDKRSGSEVQAVQLAAEQVEKRAEDFVLVGDPSIQVESRAFKMSKSRGNVINPDWIVADYGADSLRMYEMFMGPLEATKPWSTRSVDGVSKFLARVWRMVADEVADDVRLNPAVRDVDPSDEQSRMLHKTIKAVTEDLDVLAFNTAISRMMEFVNFFHGHDPKPKSIVEPFVLLLSPFAPHLGEELWQLLGHDGTLAYEPWPRYDESLIRESEIEVPVQVNGKVRSRITVAADAANDVLEKTALADAKIQAQLDGKKVRKVIVVPGKLVNIVAG